MKKYLVSLTIKDIEAWNEVDAVMNFEKLISDKKIELEWYKVKEQAEPIKVADIEHNQD